MIIVRLSVVLDILPVIFLQFSIALGCFLLTSDNRQQVLLDLRGCVPKDHSKFPVLLLNIHKPSSALPGMVTMPFSDIEVSISSSCTKLIFDNLLLLILQIFPGLPDINFASNTKLDNYIVFLGVVSLFSLLLL